MIAENEEKKKHTDNIIRMTGHDEAFNHDPMLKKVRMLQKEIEKEEKIKEVQIKPKPIIRVTKPMLPPPRLQKIQSDQFTLQVKDKIATMRVKLERA